MLSLRDQKLYKYFCTSDIFYTHAYLLLQNKVYNRIKPANQLYKGGKIMANWNEIKKNATNVAKTTIRKTSELAENATMQMKLSALRKKRDELYTRLGKLTYKQLKLGASQAEAIAKTVKELDKVSYDIVKQKEKIEAVKAERELAKEQRRMEQEAADKMEEEFIMSEVQTMINSDTPDFNEATLEQDII